MTTQVLDTKSMTRLNNLKKGETISGTDTQFFEAPELKKLAARVIDDKGIELGPAAVLYWLTYPNISKKRSAKVTKCNKKLKFISGYDYIIEFSGETWDMLDDRSQYMLMWHQLLHLNPVYKAKQQKWTMKKRKPGIADYEEIHNEHGSDWQKTIQSTQGALYDLNPIDESQVSLF